MRMSGSRIVVTNASPVIHLARASHLDTLLRLYDKIYCAEAAARDIKYPQEAVDFVAKHATVLPVKDNARVVQIQSAHPKLALGEIETFVLSEELSAEEALFLNTKAQNVFRQEYAAKIRDIINLPDRDTNRLTFKSEREINQFYLALAKVIPAYKPLVKILQSRRLVP